MKLKNIIIILVLVLVVALGFGDKICSVANLDTTKMPFSFIASDKNPLIALRKSIAT